MDKKYISELLEKRKRLRNFIKFPYQYEKIDEYLEEKVINAKSQLFCIPKILKNESNSQLNRNQQS